MTDYEGAQAYVTTNLLLEIYYLQNRLDNFMAKIRFAKDETNSCYIHAVGILHEPGVQCWKVV